MDVFSSEMNVVGCEFSEKFDGVQGIWDGKCMKTRTGNTIAVPDWWANDLPDCELIGELWTGRGEFDRVRSIVCRKAPTDDWQFVKFMVFSGQEFLDDSHANAVPGQRIAVESVEQFNAYYQAIIKKGGEGVVVTLPDGTNLKRKPVMDDDGVVVDHIEGTGRNEGLCNGLVLKLRSGKKLRVSAGMTEALRCMPPDMGTVIRFFYNGFTSKGLPRHARIDAERAEDASFCFA